jgi:DNA polymerase/3'-5' exonuclease PolX
MNDIIVNEFKRLIAYLKDKLDTFKKNNDKKNINAYTFKIRQLGNVLGILKKYPNKITIDNYKKLIELSGIGKGSIERIGEIIKKGKLSEIGNFVDAKKEKNDAINDLEEIVGVGRAKALDFYENGITSIKILKNKIKNKEIEVNDKVLLGLKYHGVYKMNIPRKEVEKYYKFMTNLISYINKKYELDDNNNYIFEICGSYRREKLFSNDIDVLISKKKTKTDKTKSEKHLNRIISKLKSNLKNNKEKPLLLDDMTDKNITTKYMGFSKLKDNPVRRIDIRFVAYDSFHSAILYFTGSSDFNKKMRNIAKSKNYKLSEYGLFNENGKKFKVKSERDIFKLLDMEYLPPKLR